jgi:hypothetical protein
MKQYAMYEGKAYTLTSKTVNECHNCALNDFGILACLSVPVCKEGTVYEEYTPQPGDMVMIKVEEADGQ